jgi:hypothetical protein
MVKKKNGDHSEYTPIRYLEDNKSLLYQLYVSQEKKNDPDNNKKIISKSTFFKYIKSSRIYKKPHRYKKSFVKIVF